MNKSTLYIVTSLLFLLHFRAFGFDQVTHKQVMPKNEENHLSKKDPKLNIRDPFSSISHPFIQSEKDTCQKNLPKYKNTALANISYLEIKIVGIVTTTKQRFVFLLSPSGTMHHLVEGQRLGSENLLISNVSIQGLEGEYESLNAQGCVQSNFVHLLH